MTKIGVSSLRSILVDSLAAGSVATDDETLSRFATDVFWSSNTKPLAVVSPAKESEVQAVVRSAASLDLRIVPRGGGMSYTKGYIADDDRAVVLDMRRLNKVLAVSVEDGYVELESGCTWATLHAALGESGYSTGYWGPFSGLLSTVGGAVSQNSGGFGSARHGTVGESVLGLRVVLADGSAIATGSAARPHAKPFSRTNGPDVTGLFLGDNGAFGIKTRVVLRLRRKRSKTGFLSFGFPSLEKLAAAQCAIARSETVSASYGFDRLKAELATSSMSQTDGARVVYEMARSGGLLQAAKAAVNGTSFLKSHPYTIHLTMEESNDRQLSENRAAILAISRANGGTELPATVPQAMHSSPFGPLRGMLGPDGERWVPVHGLFPFSAAPEVIARWKQLVLAWREAMLEHEIQLSLLTMTVDHQFFLEPAFYWPDELLPIHRAALGSRIKTHWTQRGPNPKARAAVAEMRAEIQELFATFGGISWQVARDYPFKRHLDPAYWAVLESLKRAVDPDSVINPGSLGLN